MKGLRNNSVRPRKRVIAILLSVLMVMSIILPSGGSGVRYNAYAEGEESALGEEVQATSEEGATEESVTSEKNSEEVTEDGTEVDSEEKTEENSEENNNTNTEVSTDAASVDDTEEELIDSGSVLESENPSYDESIENEYLLGDGGTTNDITNFLNGVDLYNTNDLNNPLTVTWQVDSNSTYRMHINFAEDGTESKQFVMDTDNRTFTYTLPAGITISDVHNPLTITLDDLNTLTGTNYNYQQVGDHYVITGTFEDNASLKSAKNVKFYLDFDVKIDEGVDQLDFGNNVIIPVNVDNKPHVTIDKNSSIDLENGKIKYTITVQSKQVNNNIKISDVISGTRLKYDSSYDMTITSNMNLSTVTKSINNDGKGFGVDIASMADGETITIEYYADIDLANINSKGTVEETENNVTVKSDNDTTGDSDSTNEENKITRGTFGKSGTERTDSNGNRVVDYKVIYYAKTPANGITLTDTISEDQQSVLSYPSNMNLKITTYTREHEWDNENRWTQAGPFNGSDVSPTSVSTDRKSWTYTINDNSTKAYIYVIEYTAAANVDGLTNQTGAKNIINDGKGDTGEAWVNIERDTSNDITIDKTHNKVDIDNMKIEWQIEITVPRTGLSNETVITDTLPLYWDGDNRIDEYIANSLRLADGSKTVSFTSEVSSDNKTLTIKLNDAVAYDASGNNTIIFTYETKINDVTYNNSLTNDNCKRHENRVNIVDGVKSGNDSDTAIAAQPSIKKNSVEEWIWYSGVNNNIPIEDKNGYPVYKFTITVTNPTTPFTLTDTYNSNLKLPSDTITFINDSTKNPITIYGYVDGNNRSTEKPIDSSKITIGDGKFTVNLEESDFDKNEGELYPYYLITYYLVIDGKTGFSNLASLAAVNDDRTAHLSNTATSGSLTDTSNFDFTYEPVSKTITNAKYEWEEVKRSEYLPEFSITLNPAGAKLNDGNDIIATDEFTNLSIVYTSISVEPNDVGITWDMSGNELSFVIPDETPVTITYKARITGTPDDQSQIQFSNDFNYAGSSSNVTRKAKISADSGGTGSHLNIEIIKYEDGNLNKTFNNVEFGVYDAAGNPLKYLSTSSKAEQDVVLVTGADNNEDGLLDGDGCAIISQDNVDFYADTKYYIKELKAPEGYLLDDTLYEFTAIYGDDPDYTPGVYKYINWDTLKIRNYKPNIYFQKVKVDDTATSGYSPLPGAVFTLYNSDKTPYQVGGNNVTATSDDKGYVSFSNLFVNLFGEETTYYIKETSAPTGFRVNNNYYYITFGYDENGNIVVKDSDIPNLFVNSDTVSISVSKEFTTNYSEPVDVSFGLYEESSTNSGVADTSNQIDKKTIAAADFTNYKGTAVFTGLDASKKYYVYELDKNDSPIIDTTNSVAIGDSKYTVTAEDNTGISFDENDSVKEVKFKNAEVRGSVTITKEVEFTDTSLAPEQTVIDAKEFPVKIVVSDTTYTGVHNGITFENGVGYTTIKNGDTNKITLDGLKIGATVTVTEVDSSNSDDAVKNAFTYYTYVTASSVASPAAATVSETSTPNIALKNVYERDKAKIKINKTATGLSDVKDMVGKVEFSIYETGNNTTPLYTWTLSDADFINNQFSEEFEVPAGKTYQIHETITDIDGYTYVKTRLINGSSNPEVNFSTSYVLTGTLTKDSPEVVNLENVYTQLNGSFTLGATKKLDETVINGTDYPEFKFYYEYLGEESDDLKPDSIPANASGTAVLGTLGAGGVVTFDPISYSTSNGDNTPNGKGTHIYKIYEGNDGYTGITNDKNYYIVTVKVEDGTNGVLSTAVKSIYKYTYNNGTYTVSNASLGTSLSVVEFNNTSKECKLSLEAQKEITNGTHSLAGFKFELSSTTYAASYTDVKTTNGEGKVTFDELTFGSDNVGHSYVFTVKEQASGDSSLDDDTGVYTVTVNVSVDDATKEIKAEVTSVTKNDGTSTTDVADKNIVFTNKVKDNNVSVALTAHKTLKKARATTATSDIKDDTGATIHFEFKIERVDDTGTAITGTGEYSNTATNNGNGLVSFPNISYEYDNDNAENNIYYYEITETAGSNQGYIYSTIKYYAKVVLSRNTSGTIDAEVTYYQGSMNDSNIVTADNVIFENTEKSGLLVLNAKKTIIGASNADNQFDFVATLTTDSTQSYTGNNDADGKVTINIDKVFTPLDVVRTSAQPYVYTITETSKTGFVCDSTTYYASVVFNYDNGVIKPTVTYYKDSVESGNVLATSDVPEFKNIKSGSVEVELKAKKTFDNDEPGTKVFSFQLYKDDIADANLIETVNNTSNGNVTFSKLRFTESDIPEDKNTAVKTYYIKEFEPAVQTQIPGYDYDKTEYKVVITLTRDATEGIKESHEITKIVTGGTDTTVSDDELLFNNKYKDTGTNWPLSVKKVLSGNSTMVEGMFKFELHYAHKDDLTGKIVEDGIVNAGGTDEQIKENDSDGNVVFGNITVSTNSTNYFVICEQQPAETNGILNYDINKFYLKVVVEANEDEITVTNCGEDGTGTTPVQSGDMTFTNSIEVNVNKVKADGTSLSGATLQIKNGSTVLDDFTSSTSAHTFNNVSVGTVYTLHEATAPVGYDVAEDIQFKVEYNSTAGKYELKVKNADDADFTAVSGTGVELKTVTMSDSSKKLYINKKASDVTSGYLADAKLKIKDKNGDTFVDEWTTANTENDKEIDLSTLVVGDWYTLEETTAPFGYQKAESIQFKIKDDNNLYIKATDGSESMVAPVNGVYYITMSDKPIELTINKYKYGTTNPETLNGAVFQILRASDNHIVYDNIRVVSSGTVTMNVSRLEAGTEYKLVEITAPEGFLKADPITFKLTTDNKIQIGSAAASDDLTINVYDKEEKVIYIRKVDPDNPDELLAGALMVVNEGSNEKYSFETSSTEPYGIRTSLLTKNREYRIIEKKVPYVDGKPGYYLAEEIRFKLDSNDKLFVIKADGTEVECADYTITMEDKARESVRISKQDLAGEELDGAKLRITDENGNNVPELSVDSNGRIIEVESKLEHISDKDNKWEIDFATFEIGKTYIFEEITAPYGYEVAERIKFKLDVDSNGNTVVYVEENGTFVSRNDLSLVMQDAPIEKVKFYKIDGSTGSGEQLANAELTIFKTDGTTVFNNNVWTTGSAPKEILLSDFLQDGETEAEFVLRETSVPDGFYKADDVEFKVVKEITAGGATKHVLYVKEGGNYEPRNTCVIRMVDELIYKVKISKVDLTSEEEVPGAHIQIIDENGSVVTEWDSTDAPKEIEGLRPNVTYTLRETVAPLGYKITTDTTFALKSDATIDYDKTTTAISSEGVLLVKDDITSLNFTKYGLVNESCAPDPAAYMPLSGVEFEAYSIDEDGNVSDTPVATAKSSKNGIVLFTKLAKGKYQIRESKSVDAFKICEDYFYATVDDNNFAGLTDKDGNKIEGNRIVDDQYRTDIVFTKVSEKDKSKKLAGSTYGLYRKNDSAEETLVATAVSDKDGVVTFKGVITGINYVIRELESPEGYYVSENPIEMSFKVDGEDVVRATLKDGSGTIVLGTNGEITWLEPSVVVNFLKVDGDNNPLPGATLAVLDMNGAPVKDADGKEIKWVSTTTAYEVADVFEDGVSYQLVELAAPEGYDIAEPIVFEIPDDKVGTGENKVISVTMIDRLTTTVTPPEKTTPPSVKTGDTTPIKPVAAMMFISLAGIVYLLIFRRRHKKMFK